MSSPSLSEDEDIPLRQHYYKNNNHNNEFNDNQSNDSEELPHTPIYGVDEDEMQSNRFHELEAEEEQHHFSDKKETSEFTINMDRKKEKELKADIYDDQEDESQEKKNPFKAITSAHARWMLSLAKRQWVLLVLGTLALLIASSLNLVAPSYLGRLIDVVLKSDNSKSTLNAIVVTLLIIFFVQSIFVFMRNYLFTLAGERIVAYLRKALFEHVVIQEIGFFDLTKTGDLVNRLSSDTTALENAVTVNLSMGLRYTVQVIGSIIVLFVLSWRLCLVMITIIPVIIIAAVIYGSFVKRLSKRVQDALALASDVATESIGNIRTVRAFGQERKQSAEYNERVETSYQKAKKLALANGVFMGSMMFAANMCIVSVVWYGGSLVIDGNISPGELASFLIYTLYVGMGLGGIASLWFDIMKALGATERIFRIIRREPKIKIEGGETIPFDQFQGKINFDQVSFHYPSRPDTAVLNKISLQLDPGQTLALVGPSGAGKSTVAGLIQRLYDPSHGSVQIDHNDLRVLDPQWFRGKMAIVSQEPALFATSIRDNIAYGNPNATLDQIQHVAKKANAHDFIEAFPNGYETMVGERGVRLSGGQKQRVAIARALLIDPKILLLDEATSALDAESEFLVQQALERLMNGRTVLIIAHRLSTVKSADLVAVMQDGELRELGTHDHLIEQGGLYHQLVERQLTN
eukprot:gb/GECH01014255.1/.p1 GENE.gb/GECH01014255.1/~~gb/GECH01014255.1/.p1  ORF type:complete len:691 (+),score=192.87 gb/GECH01014255.1/:1-2073(+)